MSIHPDTHVLACDRLGPDDLIEVVGFLDRDPVVNVYLLALAMRDALRVPRDEWWGVRRGVHLEALLYLGAHSGAVLPVGAAADALTLLARRAVDRLGLLPRRWQVIGPRAAVGAVVARLQGAGFQPRLSRRQLYMALERETFRGVARLPELRPARPEDFGAVFESGAELRSEELEEDPRLADPIAYARRVEEECRDGYTWIWTDAEGLKFRASVSAITADAAQIAGVYTPPKRRNQGFAQRGMGELLHRMFEKSRAAALFVNDFNAPAVAVYRRLGFKTRAEWASAFYGSR